MSDKESTLQFDGLDISVCRGADGTIVVQVDGPVDEKNDGKDSVPTGEYKGSPDIRIWLNDALIYAHGQGGDDLQNRGHELVPNVRESLERLDVAVEEADRKENERNG